jgi:hypothetical protein
MGCFSREIATSQVLPMQQNRIRTFITPPRTYIHFRPVLCERTYAFSSELNQTLGTVYYRARRFTPVSFPLWRPVGIQPTLAEQQFKHGDAS